MTIRAELEAIKTIPYKVAGIAEKMLMIQKLMDEIEPEDSCNKWLDVISIFANTRVQSLVFEAHVRSQLQYYLHRTDVTFSCKADIARMLTKDYQQFLDVDAIIKEIFGDQYDDLIARMSFNIAHHQEFHNRLQKMEANSTMEQIAAVFQQVEDDLQKV